jgi:uncharacterized membrane protein
MSQTPDWLRPDDQWSLRTWIILGLLSLLPIMLTIVLFTVR